MLPVVVLSARENRCAFGFFLWAGRWVGWVWGFLGFVGVLGCVWGGGFAFGGRLGGFGGWVFLFVCWVFFNLSHPG